MGEIFLVVFFTRRVLPLTCGDWNDQVGRVVTDCETCNFTIVWISSILQSFLTLSDSPTDVAVSSKQNEIGEFVDAMPSVSVEKAFVRAAKMTEPCCGLVHSAELYAELLKKLTSYPFSIFGSFLLVGVGGSGGECCVVNQGTQYGCFFNYQPSCADLRHLWFLLEKHQYRNKETGVTEALAKQLNKLRNGSLSKYLSSCGLFECRMSSVRLRLIISCCLQRAVMRQYVFRV